MFSSELGFWENALLYIANVLLLILIAPRFYRLYYPKKHQLSRVRVLNYRRMMNEDGTLNLGCHRVARAIESCDCKVCKILAVHMMENSDAEHVEVYTLFAPECACYVCTRYTVSGSESRR